MKEVGFSVKKSLMESYKIRSSEESFAWADINLDYKGHTGRIQIASDYGDWQNYWGSCGCFFKKFLQGLNINYFAGKIGASSCFDLQKTIEGLKSDLENWDVDSLTYEETKAEIKRLSDSAGKDEFVCIAQDSENVLNMTNHCPEIEYSVEPGFQKFWDEIWPVFLEELKNEEAGIDVES